MNSDSKILWRNLVLTAILSAVALYALRTNHESVAAACIAFVGGLWLHSGRARDDGPSTPGMSALPVLCLAFLAFGACDRQAADFCAGLHVQTGGPSLPAGPAMRAAELEIQGGINSDYLRLTTQAALPAACASPYGCAYLKSADALPRLVSPSGVEYIAGTAWRAYQFAGTPGGVATGDIWHDTVTGYLMWRSGGGSITIGASTGIPLTAPVITGGLTASGLASFTGDVTLGDAAADIITNKGTLRIHNTANTFYVTLTHAASANRAVTFPDAAGQVLLDTATQTVTNKTLTTPTITSAVLAGTTTGAGLVAKVNGGTGQDNSAAIGQYNFWAGPSSGAGAAGYRTIVTGDIATALTTPGPVGSVTPGTGAFSTLAIASAPTVATFFKTCTITSAAAATPVNCLSAADVPAALSAKLGKWHLYINGATNWATTATCVIEDTAGTDLVSIAVAAMTGDTFVDDGSANVTKAAPYRLGTGGAVDTGLQISCNANGTGSDAVFVLMGTVQ